MPPPADAVGYREPDGAWREAAPPPPEPGYFNAGGAWKEETPNPNVAGYVNDGGNFVQAPLVKPEMAPRLETVGGVVVDGGGGGGVNSVGGGGGGGGGGVASTSKSSGGAAGGGNAEAANDRESAASAVRVDHESQGPDHVSFPGEASKKNSEVEEEASGRSTPGREPSARESAASLADAAVAMASAKVSMAPEDGRDRMSTKSGKKSLMDEEAQQFGEKCRRICVCVRCVSVCLSHPFFFPLLST